MLQQAEKTLQTYFGYDAFRPGQQEVISSLLNGENALGLMPTGGGKSLCYQIPGLMLNGTAVIISPLISLMKDQVDALMENGIAATFINSSLTQQEANQRLADIRKGRYQFVYVAPERFDSQSFFQTIASIRLSLIAFDEAHCISQWGHDFRPSYRSIVQTLSLLPNLPVLAGLTATATDQVIQDIARLLDVKNDHIVSTGFARDNLTFHVLKGENKKSFITRYIEDHPNDTGIIYTATRKEADQLTKSLAAKGHSVTCYHAGLPELERARAQKQFIYDEKKIIVATNAFGMGIDKSNVRFVIHYQMPMNMESYYQEAGRAGRDGEPSDCFLLFSPQDVMLQKFLIEQSIADDQKKADEYQKLQQMVAYCHSNRCLPRVILDYFEDPRKPDDCGRCSNCVDEREQVDRTRDVQIVLSTVKRMGERFGATMTAKVLKGARVKKLLEFKLDQVSTYGMLRQYSEKEIVDLIQFLLSEGYLQLQGGQFPTIRLDARAVPVLKGEETVLVKAAYRVESTEVEYDEALFEQLRAIRSGLAKENGVPPYVIFSDATLHEMATYLPDTEDALLATKGVGERKLQQYGDDFLRVIVSWKNGERETVPVRTAKPKKEPSRLPAPDQASHLFTYELLNEGHTPKEIAKLRAMSDITIQSHLVKAYQEGNPLPFEEWLTEDQEQQIVAIYDELDEKKLKPVKDALSEDLSYFQIQMALAKHGRLNESS